MPILLLVGNQLYKILLSYKICNCSHQLCFLPKNISEISQKFSCKTLSSNKQSATENFDRNLTNDTEHFVS